jgi:hypothetical protein
MLDSALSQSVDVDRSMYEVTDKQNLHVRTNIVAHKDMLSPFPPRLRCSSLFTLDIILISLSVLFRWIICLSYVIFFVGLFACFPVSDHLPLALVGRTRT